MSHVRIFQQEVSSETPLLVQCSVYEVSNKYLLVTQMGPSLNLFHTHLNLMG